jgi:hypothetical protein
MNTSEYPAEAPAGETRQTNANTQPTGHFS